ncbi:hypothetical protein F5Y04DRAFT_252761 [Hypomontagnella monticulosa]|nr:hypothetical protein F5Y04DRAFT_252761 [Hypomontagnella monticulosa]
MAFQDQSFNSNNPFRRKLTTTSLTIESPAPDVVSNLDGSSDSLPRPPFTTFKSAPPKDERHDGVGEKEIVPVESKPKKIVKRVRVQSPPPSSPEDTTPVTRFPPVGDDDDNDYDDDAEDNDDDDDDDDEGDNSDSPEYDERVGVPNTSIFARRDEDSSERVQIRPPANPFSKTLQDIEHAGQGKGQGQDANVLAAGAAARATLDVDSFKRLLLTGYANTPNPSSASTAGGGGNSGTSNHPQPSIHDGASNTDASSVSRQSIFDAIVQETPRTSHETSEPEDPEERRGILPTSPLASIPSSSARKKPPPPSSRHGKLIKIELGADVESRSAKSPVPPISINTTSLPSIAPPRKSNSHSATPLQSLPITTDVNKPLPLTPFRPSVEEAVDSPFDREAIGKGPEPFVDPQPSPRLPTPPAATRNRSESNGSTQPRKPAAPPPRRHGRSDSKAPPASITNADDDTPPRSSLESNRSRADSFRTNANPGSNLNAPAPPPPRRPNHARQGSSFTSPSQGTFAPISAAPYGIGESERSPTGIRRPVSNHGGHIESLAGLATITTNKDGLPKLSPPPPPPARQASTRRPPSVRSMDLGTGPGSVRRVSREKDGGPAPPPPPPRQRGSSRASVETPAAVAEDAKSVSGDSRKENVADAKQGAEILADLDALQKEVDALMGRYGKTG